MQVDRHSLGWMGWLGYTLAGLTAFATAHWGALLGVLFGLVGATCHVIQTRLRAREVKLAEARLELLTSMHHDNRARVVKLLDANGRK